MKHTVTINFLLLLGCSYAWLVGAAATEEVKQKATSSLRAARRELFTDDGCITIYFASDIVIRPYPETCTDADATVFQHVFEQTILEFLKGIKGVTNPEFHVCPKTSTTRRQLLRTNGTANEGLASNNETLQWEEEDHRSLYGSSKFVFRGVGTCSMCYGDNKDGRRQLIDSSDMTFPNSDLEHGPSHTKKVQTTHDQPESSSSHRILAEKALDENTESVLDTHSELARDAHHSEVLDGLDDALSRELAVKDDHCIQKWGTIKFQPLDPNQFQPNGKCAYAPTGATKGQTLSLQTCEQNPPKTSGQYFEHLLVTSFNGPKYWLRHGPSGLCLTTPNIPISYWIRPEVMLWECSYENNALWDYSPNYYWPGGMYRNIKYYSRLTYMPKDVKSAHYWSKTDNLVHQSRLTSVRNAREACTWFQPENIGEKCPVRTKSIPPVFYPISEQCMKKEGPLRAYDYPDKCVTVVDGENRDRFGIKMDTCVPGQANQQFQFVKLPSVPGHYLIKIKGDTRCMYNKGFVWNT